MTINPVFAPAGTNRSAARPVRAALRTRLAVPALRVLIASGLTGALTGGCVQETHRVPAGNTFGPPVYTTTAAPGRPLGERPTKIVSASPGGSGAHASGPQPVFVDQCPTRLDYISDLLLRFYSAYGQLPASLEDLRPLADIDIELNFTCPASGQPYVYNPVGLQAPEGGEKRLILYDATPAHKGPAERRKGGPMDVPRRWCIVSAPAKALAPNRVRPYILTVVDLSDADFKRYTPAAVPPPTPPTPPTPPPAASATAPAAEPAAQP